MRRWIGLFIFLIGIALALFYYNDWNTAKSSADAISEEKIQEYKAQLEDINTSKQIEGVQNTYINAEYKEENDQVIEEEVVNYEFGEEMAKLIIPKLEMQYSVYWGTDPNVLSQGVGMFVSDSTTTPKGMRHTVLSGHRDTVFTELGELEIGDKLIVEYDHALYEYQINKTWITHADDRTVIVSKESPTLTLTTCYPFDFIGDAPDRYILQAELISKS